MGKLNWIHDAKEQWDERANNWHSRSINMWEKGSRKDIIPFFLKYLNHQKTICDLGCGDGYGAFLLANQGFQVTGIDLSEKMIQLAKRNENNDLQFKVGDLSKLPFHDESNDAALAINSIEWTESPFHVLKEIARILVPKGIACIGILGPTAEPRLNSYPRLLGEQVIQNTMMPWEFQKLACENGWRVIDELHVFKQAVDESKVKDLPSELKQALSFMTVFLIQKQS
ncbi:ubiquinone/menaquinone biosynthesis C-methylase UbiE [Oikeobacillus pervagus]|uniref:Ubiquinone/menaquinone biosynthesis C-methylase UbiE n=1 Tax=Oikeobacillus pervagus TaxID=1325931 RepID=A0AAJ1T4S0_9BACI|nr:class I SAM-dependent methyltransferase [Oikeobacillus pervagus]MDQ0215859.1 ubiquinone/menaquinone biosynthesis C-methylase UbiE [Oikeobacillus pervagus]